MKVFGFLLDWVSSSYQLTIWSGARDYCRQHGINLVTLVSGRPGSPEAWNLTQAELRKAIEAQPCDGFLIMTAALLTTLGAGHEQRLLDLTAPSPVVSVGEELNEHPSISVDNGLGFGRLLDHLYDHGYRRFAYAGGRLTNRDARERRDALVTFLKRRGLEVRPDRILDGEFTTAWGMEAVTRLVPSERPDFDVLVCANDDIAMGAHEAFSLKNLQVPGDVALTGFDDVRSSAQTGLTTVRQPLAELGWKAAELLADRLAGREVALVTRMPTQAMIRQSCGCLSLAAELARAELTTPITELSREGLPQEHATRLSQLFLAASQTHDGPEFLHSLRRLLNAMHRADLPAGLLHFPLSVLRHQALLTSTTPEARAFVEMVVHQARILLTEVMHTSSVQTGTHQRLIQDQLNDLNVRLTNSRDNNEQREVLDDLIPKLGAAGFWLSLPGEPWWPRQNAQPWSVVAQALIDREGLVGFFGLDPGDDPTVLSLFSQMCERISWGVTTIRRIQNLEAQVARRTDELRHALVTVEESNLRLKDLALRDELTGLYNRRGFVTLAEHQLKAQARKLRPLTLFYGDLDGLKIINDTRGHDAGDEAIRTAARLLASTFRVEDVVARVGGDEFVVLAPECSLNDASGLAERVAEAFTFDGSGYGISLGWIVIDPKTKKPLADAMKEADDALYRVKQAKKSARVTKR